MRFLPIRSIHSYARALALPIALLSLICISSTVAKAGEWYVKFTCTGSTQWNDHGTSVTNNWATLWPSTTEVALSTNPSVGDQASDTPWSTIDAYVTPILVWHPSNSTDLPPTSARVMVIGDAEAGDVIGPPEGGLQADDGFSDPAISIDMQGSIDYIQSTGHHVVTVANPTQNTTVSLPSYHLTAVGGDEHDNWSWSTVCSLQVGAIIPADLKVWSTSVLPTTRYNWDPHNPTFVSGTNCKITATATASSGYYIKNAKLLINGTVINSYTDSASHSTSQTLTSYFDSTHFSDASNVSITYFAEDSHGNQYYGEATPPVRNTAYILGNDVLDGGSLSYGRAASQNASTAFTAMMHSVLQSTTHNKATILTNLPAYTVFYTWTHGYDFPSVFGDCFASSSWNADHYLCALASDETTTAISVTQSVAGKSSTQPPYNFVFLDACKTADSGTMAGAFGIDSSSIDQAFLGYTTLTDDSAHNRDWTLQVLTDLQNGLAVGVLTIDGAVTHANSVIGYPLNGGIRAPTYIFGDINTKTHGVYNGTGATQWYR